MQFTQEKLTSFQNYAINYGLANFISIFSVYLKTYKQSKEYIIRNHCFAETLMLTQASTLPPTVSRLSLAASEHRLERDL